ncbi:hypothetical protein DEIPH_ctg011orf0023 [Deinococcus phoenicis]|uniref:Uncharacterized protein n=1 Tax=Deinococcus phoenicis TaxID=1476583 RepID=A0A016QSQ5_9DEIO|nr:hypothetical protein [Deinococcus phoenicis]EYB69058.1 hypothetical protein DEIPH_ctg011orf0023 [Deinococcus phoenicis]
MTQDSGWNDLPTLPEDRPAPLNLGNARASRQQRFRRYRDHVYAEAMADVEERQKWQERNLRHGGPDGVQWTGEELGAVSRRVDERLGSGLAFYEGHILPAWSALRRAREAGDAPAWDAAMLHAESLLPEGWDARTVASRENGKQGGKPRGERALSERFNIRLYDDQRERLEALGVNVSEWIRDAVDERLKR